jgi:hypothetical protein
LPPVSQLSRLAISYSSRPMPSVIMISARCRTRVTTNPLSQPNSPATAAASSKPDSGSPQPALASSPAV